MGTYHPGWHDARHGLAERLGRRADAVGMALARAWVGLV
jgi:hypothetical protein